MGKPMICRSTSDPGRIVRGWPILVAAAACVVASCADNEPTGGPAVLSEDGTAVLSDSEIIPDSPGVSDSQLPTLRGPCDPCDRPVLTAEDQRFAVTWLSTPCHAHPVVAVSSESDRVLVNVRMGPEILVDGDCDAAVTEGRALIVLAEPLGARDVAVTVAA
jgi:hypothetical protein